MQTADLIGSDPWISIGNMYKMLKNWGSKFPNFLQHNGSTFDVLCYLPLLLVVKTASHTNAKLRLTLGAALDFTLGIVTYGPL